MGIRGVQFVLCTQDALAESAKAVLEELQRMKVSRNEPQYKNLLLLAAVELARSRMLSWTGYYNSVLTTILSVQIARLQKIQNHGARLVFRRIQQCHTSFEKQTALTSCSRMNRLQISSFVILVPPTVCPSCSLPSRYIRPSSRSIRPIFVNLKSAGARSFQRQLV